MNVVGCGDGAAMKAVGVNDGASVYLTVGVAVLVVGARVGTKVYVVGTAEGVAVLVVGCADGASMNAVGCGEDARIKVVGCGDGVSVYLNVQLTATHSSSCIALLAAYVSLDKDEASSFVAMCRFSTASLHASLPQQYGSPKKLKLLIES